MHGHSYHLKVFVGGPTRNDGFILDYDEIDAVVDPVVAELDHRTLNEIVGLSNPTVENILPWIGVKLSFVGELPVVRLELRETDRAGCVLEFTPDP